MVTLHSVSSVWTMCCGVVITSVQANVWRVCVCVSSICEWLNGVRQHTLYASYLLFFLPLQSTVHNSVNKSVNVFVCATIESNRMKNRNISAVFEKLIICLLFNDCTTIRLMNLMIENSKYILWDCDLV